MATYNFKNNMALYSFWSTDVAVWHVQFIIFKGIF